MASCPLAWLDPPHTHAYTTRWARKTCAQALAVASLSEQATPSGARIQLVQMGGGRGGGGGFGKRACPAGGGGGNYNNSRSNNNSAPGTNL